MQKVLSLLQGSQFKLKLFLWLMFGVLVAHCAGLKLTIWIVEQVLIHLFPGEALPGATARVLSLNRLTVWLPLPWFLICVIQGLRPKITVEGCLLYAATILLVMVITFWMTLAGSLMPLYWINPHEQAFLSL